MQWSSCDLLLVIDDEPQIRRVVRHALEGEAARVIEASSGREGLAVAAAERPALIVLDLGLPDMQGVDVCHEIRRTSSALIVVLSARHSDEEKVLLFDAGADDYVTKPFSTIEFRARVGAHLRRLRRGTLSPDASIQLDAVTVDLAKPSMTKDGSVIHLTRTEWTLLRALLERAGRTVTHRQLFTAVWRGGSGDAQQYLRVQIHSLRRKIEADPVRPRFIITEPGVGYRLDLPPQE